jgi:hypothetical protein
MGLSKSAVETSVGGKAEIVRLAIELLDSEGYIAIAKGARGALVCTFVKPFEEE